MTLRISVSQLIATASTPRDLPWSELVAWLASSAPTVVPQKDDVTLFTLTDAGAGVQDSEVRAVWGVLLDYDGTTPAQRDQAIAAAKELGAGFFYTTHSNGVKLDPKRPDATERFRIGLAFDRPLEGADLRQWKPIWKVVAEAVGRFHPKKAPGVAESNIGRRWYLPASNPAAPTPCSFEAWDGLPPVSLDVLLEASRGVAPVVAVVDELDLEQGEAVGRAELVKLAASLTRKKSEEHQRVGRALRRMVEGQGFGASRGTMQWQVAGEIASAYPFANAAYIADLLRPALEADGPPTDDFADQLRRQQAAKQTEIAERKALYDAFPKPLTPGAKPGTLAALGATVAHVAASIDLRLDDRGKIANCISNVLTIMTRHPAWKDVLSFDELANAVIVGREPPMRDADRPSGTFEPRPWTDVDDVRTAAWIMDQFSFEPSPSAIASTVETAARRRSFHPVREYLRALTWDGVPRLERMLATYFGAADNAYHRAVGLRFMISAVARAFKPCKADLMLILEGGQGAFKSQAVAALCSTPRWFSDTPLNLLDTKAAGLSLWGKWIIEIGELAAFSRADANRIKTFVSSCSDNLRAPYGRRNQDFDRQCVFVGTTNEAHYLTDTTGNRRFLPVACDRIALDELRRDRDQLWAEATARYQAGEQWWLTAGEAALARVEQAEREVVDPWEETIERFTLAPYVPQGGGAPVLRESFTVGDVLGYLGIETKDRSRAAETRVGTCLAKLGWQRRRVRLADGARVYRYSRGLTVPTAAE
jgi:predicted P-loop ATPase